MGNQLYGNQETKNTCVINSLISRFKREIFYVLHLAYDFLVTIWLLVNKFNRKTAIINTDVANNRSNNTKEWEKIEKYHNIKLEIQKL